jgi:hypothetical protein
MMGFSSARFIVDAPSLEIHPFVHWFVETQIVVGFFQGVRTGNPLDYLFRCTNIICMRSDKIKNLFEWMGAQLVDH